MRSPRRSARSRSCDAGEVEILEVFGANDAVGSRGGVTQVRVEFMDDQSRSIIRNVKGPGTFLLRRESLEIDFRILPVRAGSEAGMRLLTGIFPRNSPRRRYPLPPRVRA